MSDTASVSMEQISIRLEPEIYERADTVAKALATQPEYQGFRMSRAAILRMAMLHGLAVLEQRYLADATKLDESEKSSEASSTKKRMPRRAQPKGEPLKRR